MAEPQRLQQELDILAAERSAANALDHVRSGKAPPDLLYSLVELRPPHERRAFMRILQKEVERKSTPPANPHGLTPYP